MRITSMPAPLMDKTKLRFNALSSKQEDFSLQNMGPNYKKILRLSYDVIIIYDNRKSNLR